MDPNAENTLPEGVFRFRFRFWKYRWKIEFHVTSFKPKKSVKVTILISHFLVHINFLYWWLFCVKNKQNNIYGIQNKNEMFYSFQYFYNPFPEVCFGTISFKYMSEDAGGKFVQVKDGQLQDILRFRAVPRILILGSIGPLDHLIVKFVSGSLTVNTLITISIFLQQGDLSSNRLHLSL